VHPARAVKAKKSAKELKDSGNASGRSRAQQDTANFCEDFVLRYVIIEGNQALNWYNSKGRLVAAGGAKKLLSEVSHDLMVDELTFVW
jgi:hypothetical protein